MSEPVCACGHALDDHKRSFMQPCLMDGCDCDAFDHEPSYDDDSENDACAKCTHGKDGDCPECEMRIY